MTIWNRQGIIFDNPGLSESLKTHAANPVAERLGENDFRIYFASRDAEQRSSISSFKLSLAGDKAKVSDVDAKRILTPGEWGSFDDCGVVPGCMVQTDEADYLYYLGWTLCATVPFRNSIGLAIRKRGESTFTRASQAPVLDRNHVDPLTISYPWVEIEDGVWRMWYGTHSGWTGPDVDTPPFYHLLKYAESDDGIDWRRDGRVVLDLTEEGEYAISCPKVIRRNGLYHMWFTWRGDAYTIGYAISRDGLNWVRRDDLCGLVQGDEDWENGMVCYPCLMIVGDKLHMLYNGNEYGKAGIGLASCDLADLDAATEGLI